MTATEPQYDAEGNVIIETPPETQGIRDLRAAAERGTEATARADALEREIAFVRALPAGASDTPIGKMFITAYQGEMTTEAIQAAAAEVGIAVAAAVVDPADAETQAAQQARGDLATGSVPPGEQPDPELIEDPQQRGLEMFQQAMKQGRSADAAAAEYFDRVVSAAVRGDERALWRGHYTDEQLAGAQ